MVNSLASGRHVASRIVMLQLAVAVLAGLVFLLQGPREALAAALGAMLVASGNWLLAMRALSDLHGAHVMLARLLAGILLKWFVIIGGLGVILLRYKLPALPAVAGLVAAHAIYLLAFRFKG